MLRGPARLIPAYIRAIMRTKSLRRSATILNRNILGTAVFDTEQHYANHSVQSMAETREMHGPSPCEDTPIIPPFMGRVRKVRINYVEDTLNRLDDTPPYPTSA